MSETTTAGPAGIQEPAPTPEPAPQRRPRRRRLTGLRLVYTILGGLALIGAVTGGWMALTAGETFLVTTTVDAVDANIGDEECATSAGTCSLRAAIQEANALPGADSIEVPSGTYELTLQPINDNFADSGDLDITSPVTIRGAGSATTIVDAGAPPSGAPPNERGMDRIIEVHDVAGDVTIEGMTLREGYSDEEGGAIMFGTPPPDVVEGAPVPTGVLTLRGVHVRDSFATKAGGGLYNVGRGRIEVIASTFSGNAAGGEGGAINNATNGTVNITAGSQIVDNPGLYIPDPNHDPLSTDPPQYVPGPGVYEADGGAIANAAEGDTIGTIRISDSTVARNTSGTDGGGIHNAGDGLVVVHNTMLTDNRALSGGGALHTNSGIVRITDSTITGNVANEGGGLYSAGERTKAGLRPRFELSRGDLSLNAAIAAGGGVYSDGDGQLTLTDVTVNENTAGAEGGGISGNGYANLTINGGTINKNTAIEYGGGFVSASGRATVIDRVTVADNFSGEIIPGEITGGGDGGGGGFTDGAGPVTITNSTFSGNSSTGPGGGLALHSFGTVEVRDTVVRKNSVVCEECDGGGVEQSGGRTTFQRVIVEENTATANGGGIHNSSSAEFTVLDTTIARNVAESGGGFANQSDSTLVIRGSLILNNRARMGPREGHGLGGGMVSISDGGGVIENTTISGNTAVVGGGGMFHDADAGMKLINVTIWNNTAPLGAGIGVVESDYVPPVPPQANPGLTARNTIVGGSCDAQITTEGGNLDTGNMCFLEAVPEGDLAPTFKDRRNVRLVLDAIADNGGPTMTHALPDNSIAVDGGVDTITILDGSVVGACPDVDQRGVTRPRNLSCDSGAYEYEGPPAAPDNEDPETTYISGPIQNTEETQIFTFTGSDNITAVEDLQYECRLIEADPTEPPELVEPGQPEPPELRFGGCTSPWEVPLTEEGDFTFEVKAIDRAGRFDETPAKHQFDGLDLIPPDTTIVEYPPNPSNGRAATFGWVSTDNVTPQQFMEFECRLDSRDPEDWIECFNPASYGDLTTGTHTFEVRATDGAENIETSPARYTWTVADPVNCDDANITLRPVGDAWVDESEPGLNSSFEEFLTVRSNDEPGEAARSLVQFTLPDDAPACELQGALLRLHSEGDPGRTLNAQRLDGQWLAHTVTWATQPGVTGPVASSASVNGEGWVEFDITQAVLDMMGGEANNGFRISDATEVDPEGDPGEQNFASAESPFAPPEDPDPAPQLVLLYEPGSGPVPAPPVPAEEDTTVFCGMYVTESIRVGNDLTNCLGEGLVVAAPNIDVNLNGHVIDGPNYMVENPGQEEGFPAGIRNGGHDNVVIRNGTVQEFGAGVFLTAGTVRNVIVGMTLQRNAVAGVELLAADDGRNGNTIMLNTIKDNELGVHLFTGTDNSVIEFNTITGNVGEAILLAESHGNRISNNTIHGIPTDPLLDSDGGVLLEGSSGNQLYGNTVRDTGDAGLVLALGSNDNVIENNDLYRNGDAGVSISDSARNQVIENVSHQQSDGGVVLNDAPNTVVRGNDVRFNPGGILAAGSDNLVVENNLASDTLQAGIGISSAMSFRVVGNTAHRTGGSGISIDAGFFDANGNPIHTGVIEGNFTDENSESGISVSEGGHLIRGNTAYNNAGNGIAAELNVDGGGNIASGNGEVEQCIGVVCLPGTTPPLTPFDITAPETAIDTNPGNPSPSSSATFTFSSTDAGTPETAMVYECRIDPGTDPLPEEPDLPDVPDPNNPFPEPPDPVDPPEGLGWEECISPVHYPFLEPGPHRFEVRALDWADWRDLTPAVYEWEIELVPGETGPDTTAPNTTIREFPADPSATDSARFVFSGSDNATVGPNLRYECRLDGADFAPCTSPQEFDGLSVGSHTFQVRTIDLTGNEDLTPAGHTWSYTPGPADETDPDTTIVSGPDLTTVSTDATFTFSSNESGVTFECALGDADFAACTSPVTRTGLEPGEHTFHVRARDAAGNVDEEPATYSWTIGDAPVPTDVYCGFVVTTSILVRNDLLNCLSDGLVVGASDITIDLGGHLLDGSGLGAGVANAGFDSVTVTNGALTEFDVGIELAVGTNRGVVDTVDASVNEVAGVLLTDADDNVLRDNQFSQNEYGILIQKGTAGTRVLGNTAAASGGDGIHVESSNGTVIEGNLVLSSSGAGIGLGNARDTQIRDNTVEGNGSGIEVGPNALTEVLDVQRPPIPNVPEPPPPAPEVTGRPSIDNTVSGNLVTESGGPGILVEGSDMGGPAVGIEVFDNRVHDSSGPAVELNMANDNVVRDNNLRANTDGIDLAASNRNLLENNNASESSGTGISLQALSLGNRVIGNTVNVSGDGIFVSDAAGAGSGNRIERNTTNSNVGNGISVTSYAHVIRANTAHDNGGWGIYAVPGNADAGANRAEENVTPQQCFGVLCDGGPGVPDVIPPTTLLLSGPQQPTSNSSDATFRFSGTDNRSAVRFNCRLDGGAFADCVSPTVHTGLSNGPHTFEVFAIDEAGNADPAPRSFAWTVDVPPGPPQTTILSGPDPSTLETTAAFTFRSSEAGSTFECAVDGGAFADCASPTNLANLTVGTHTFQVRATDGDGDTDASPASHTWTVGAAPVSRTVGCGEILIESTRVLNDLFDCEGHGLVIGADGITVDLNGFTLDGVGLGSGVFNPRWDGVSVINGTIQEFDYGVEFDPGAGRGVLTGLTLTANQEAGILLADADDNGAGATVRANEITGNGFGIHVGPGTRGTTIVGNTLTGNTGASVLLELATGNRVEGNTIIASGGPAVSLERAGDNVIVRNTLMDNPGGGIAVGAEELPSHRNVVEENVITGSGGPGILVVDSVEVRVSANTVSGSNGAGIVLELVRDSQVLGNELRANGSGIELSESTGNRVQGNDASGSLGDGIVLDAIALENVVTLNAANGNGGTGISVEDMAPPGRGNLIEQNTANDNMGDGIYVGQPGHTVTDNVAVNNGGWGIYVEPGVVDGGGNAVGGNIEPAQCYNIVCTISFVAGTPDTEIRSGPEGETNTRYAAFTYRGSDDATPLIDITYECRLDSTREEDFGDCEYPQEYFDLAPGDHRIEIRAIDAEERVDPTPAVREWTYVPLPSGVAPDTMMRTTPPAESPLLEGLFTFTSDDPDALFECRVDGDLPGAVWVSCPEGGPESAELVAQLGYGFYEYEFEDIQLGRHTLDVRAIDREGLIDPSPVRYEWIVSGGPLTTILRGPADAPPEPLEPLTGEETTATSATFLFDSANEPLSTFACSIDMLPFVDCNTPAAPADGGPTVKTITYPDLGIGEHIFRVVATDPAGREEIEAATYEWEIVPGVVNEPPNTTLTLRPDSGTAALTFAFTGTDSLTPPTRLIFECAVDSNLGIAFEVCESPFNLLNRYSYLDPELFPGEHTFYVRAVDEAEPDGTPDPTPAEYTWVTTADTTVPESAILAGPPTRTAETEATFEFVGTDNATPTSPVEFALLEFECSLNGALYEPCTSPHQESGLEPGEHTLSVRAVDMAGNIESTPSTRTWTVVGPPVTTITGPASPLLSSITTITFSSDQPGSTFECDLPTGGGFLPCTSPLTVTGLASGPGEVEIRATNPELLVEDPPAVYAFTVADSTAPDTSIASGPAAGGALHPSALATFVVDTTEPGGTFLCTLDAVEVDCDLGIAELVDLTDGLHTFAAQAIDPSGNMDLTAVSRTFQVNLPPVTTILTAPEEAIGATTATFTFEANEPVSGFQCLLNTNGVSNPPQPCTSPISYSGLVPGDYLFAVRATDIQGNTAPLYELYEFTVGLGVTITQAPATVTDAIDARFEFVANDPHPLVRYQCSLDGVQFTLCNSGITYTALPAGQHQFQVQAVRPNMPFTPGPVTYLWTITDEVEPQTTLASTPTNPTDNNGATFVFSSNEPNVTFECALDTTLFTECTSPLVADPLTLAGHTFAVRATDSAGNVDQTPASFGWTVTADTTAPNTALSLSVIENGIDARFSVSGSDTGTAASELTFECSIDTVEGVIVWESCGPQYEVQDLLRGEHLVRARAIDEAGNVDASPVTYTLTIIGEINTFPGTDVIVEATTPPTVTPEVSVELTFPVVSVQGATTIEPLATPPAPVPTGTGPGTFQAGAQYYDISTTAVYLGPVTVCVEIDPAAYVNPAAARLLHYENGAWADVTGPPSDQANGELCGRVDTLSPFAIAVTNDPQPDQPPNTTISVGPPPVTSNYGFVFQFFGTDDLTDPLELEFECQLDGGPWESCDTLETIEVLTDGDHVIAVRAIDLAGQPDPSPATRSWRVVDLTAGDTSIESGPESPTTDTFATFEFIGEFELPGEEIGATFECAVNEGEFVPCASPYTVENLTTAGAQIFLVRVVDAAGNADATPDRYEWLIEAPADATPPNTFILSGPPDPVASETETSLSFTADQAGVEFQCRTNLGPWEDCESPMEFVNQPEGDYTIDVRATRTFDNAAGNEVTVVDATPASYSWTVSEAPNTTITSAPSSPNAGTSATFSFTSDQPGSTFLCSIDGGEFLPCVSPRVVLGLEEGPYTFAVQAINPEGAIDLSPAGHFWIQGLPPETTITHVEDIPDLEEPGIVVREIQFSGTDDRTALIELDFECRLNNAPWSGCSSPYEIEYADLPADDYVFQVRARDEGESVDPTPAEDTFTVAPAPQTTVLSGPQTVIEGVSEPVTESTTATFTFSSDQGTASFECSLDVAPPVFEACTSPATYTGLAQGLHEFQVRARGATGVVDAEPAAYEWEIGELTAPIMTPVSSPPAGTLDTTATFEWTSDDPALTYSCTLDAGPATFCTSPLTYTGLAATAHTLLVEASRPHLLVDVEPLEFLWVVIDQQAPETVIQTAPPVTSPEVTPAVFTFTGSDNGTLPEELRFECSLDGAEFAGCSSPEELVDLTPGQHTMRVRAIDLLDQVDESPAGHTWTVLDTIAPETDVTVEPPSQTLETTATFEFTSSEPGSTFNCTLDGNQVTPCTSPLVLTGLAIGEHTFAVSAVDAAGNVDTTSEIVTWTIEAPPDVTAPVTLIASGPPATTAATTALFALSASEPGVTFTCALDGPTFVPCTSPTQYFGLGVGEHALQVIATDAAGNVDATAVEHRWTITAPPAPPTTCSPVTMTQTPTGDSWVLQSSSGSTHGGDSDLKLESKSGNANARVLVKFALPAVPAACQLNDAQLQVYASSATTGRTLQARRITQNWNESSVTWGNQPSVASGTGPAAVVTTTSDPGYRNWSVRDQVLAMYLGGNNGFQLRDATEGAAAGPAQVFWSKEKGENPPRLVLTFGAGPDTVAPQTVVDSVPPVTAYGPDGLFAFSSNEPGSTFQCSLDNAAFAPCVSPVTHSGLALGAHNFRVRATDAAGNLDQSPATHSWTYVTGEPPAAPPPTTPPPPPPPPACTASPVTVSASADSWIEQKDPGKNYGSDASLKVAAKQNEASRALVGFQLPAIPGGCQVVSAELRMYDGSPTSGRTLQVRRLGGAWTENGVTWANQPSTTGAAVDAATPSGANWLEWMVTAQVQAMYPGGTGGFQIRDSAEGSADVSQQLHAREKAPDQPPELVITFG